MQTRRCGTRHVVEGRTHHVGRAREPRGAEHVGLGAHALQVVFRDTAQNGRGTGTDRGDHDEVAQALEQVVDETARVLPGLHHAVDRGERGCRISCGERVDDLVEEGAVRVAEQGDGARVADGDGLGSGRCVGAGDQLVEQRERVTGRAATGADHEREDTLFDDHALFGAQLGDVLEHRGRRHEPERIVVRAGADGAEHLLWLGGREDELDVLRRLFDELQQCVEALRRHHVRLVEDEDLVPVAAGGERRPLAQVACVVDAVVARRVDLDDIERSTAGARELDAAGADAAGHVCRPLGAVQAARQDAR